MPRSVLVDQAAALLGVSRRTVYYRIREGQLATMHTRCGTQRALMASLERLLAYPPMSAGSIMTTEYVSLPATCK